MPGHQHENNLLRKMKQTNLKLHRSRAAGALLTSLLLVACGGGESGSPSVAQAPAPAPAPASTPAPASASASASAPAAAPATTSDSGGFAGQVTGGGNVAAVTVSTAAQMQAAINAYTGNGGLVIRYNGTFDFASITDACTQ